MKPTFIILCIFLFSSSVFAQNIEAQKAYIGFEIGIFAYQKIKGTFSSVNGTFIFDEACPEKSIIDFNIDTKSVRTDKAKYQKRLHEDGFFLFEDHPKIFFKADSVCNANKGYRAYGKLTLNGETKHITVDLSLKKHQIMGKTTISRFDFNVGTARYPNAFPVHQNIKLKINYSMD
jgi:polyisoprenoid-binding protein YceI